jgi:thiamine pyrophosphate-dependent acetolactate synthase large subunit-like protein
MVDSVAMRFVEGLVAQGVRHLFTIPGVDTLPIYAALREHPTLRCVFVQHEAAASFAADGYAKASGAMAACFVVPGPGATNLLTGVASAHQDGMPMLAITSQIARAKWGRQSGHDCDLAGVYRPVVKEQFVLDDAATLLETLARAAQVARAHPPGPVHLILQNEILAQGVPPRPPQLPVAPVPALPTPPAEALDQAAAVLRAARNPIIFAGRGALDAAADVQRLAETLRVPILTSPHGRGIVPEDDPLCFGHLHFVGAEDILAQADACLAIGTRFGEYATLGWRRQPPQPLVQIDADPRAIGLNFPAAVAVVGDARPALRGLLERLDARDADSGVLCLAQQLRAQARAELAAFMAQRPTRPVHPLWLIRTLREATPRDAIFVSDGTAAQSWLMEQAFTIYEPRTHIFPEVSLTMGYALGAALGVALAQPERPVVGVLGDGSLKMQLGELATLSTLRRPLPLIVFNDGFYNALRIRQEHQYGGRYFGVELPPADFAAVARALGLYGVAVKEPEAFGPALAEALAADRPMLLDVATDHRPLSRYYVVSTGQAQARQVAA